MFIYIMTYNFNLRFLPASTFLITNILVSQNVKLQLYKTLIRPVAPYASETWVLKESEINKLMTFKREIMRKIHIWSYKNS
jgi:hypothetical protein